jgi:hypothetical protein
MEKSLGKFSQYRKLHTDGAKNTDLEFALLWVKELLMIKHQI